MFDDHSSSTIEHRKHQQLSALSLAFFLLPTLTTRVLKLIAIQTSNHREPTKANLRASSVKSGTHLSAAARIHPLHISRSHEFTILSQEEPGARHAVLAPNPKNKPRKSATWATHIPIFQFNPHGSTLRSLQPVSPTTNCCLTYFSF